MRLCKRSNFFKAKNRSGQFVGTGFLYLGIFGKCKAAVLAEASMASKASNKVSSVFCIAAKMSGTRNLSMMISMPSPITRKILMDFFEGGLVTERTNARDG